MKSQSAAAMVSAQAGSDSMNKKDNLKLQVCNAYLDVEKVLDEERKQNIKLVIDEYRKNKRLGMEDADSWFMDSVIATTRKHEEEIREFRTMFEKVMKEMES